MLLLKQSLKRVLQELKWGLAELYWHPLQLCLFWVRGVRQVKLGKFTGVSLLIAGRLKTSALRVLKWSPTANPLSGQALFMWFATMLSNITGVWPGDFRSKFGANMFVLVENFHYGMIRKKDESGDKNTPAFHLLLFYLHLLRSFLYLKLNTYTFLVFQLNLLRQIYDIIYDSWDVI